MNVKKFFLPLLPLCVFMGCGSSKPEVDVVKVEATANNALRLANADSVWISAIGVHLDFLSKRIDILDSLSIMQPFATATENQLQMALLREEVAFLRRFLENQNHVPIVNPNRQQAPKTPGPLPIEYEQAQYLFTQKQYQAAAKQFESVTVLYPKSDWTDDAWYWAGESQMALGNYAQAISAFEKVFFYPESIKQADAQFQIGMCLLRIGDKEHARTAFRKVQEFYSKSPRALQAQSELKKLQ